MHVAQSFIHDGLRWSSSRAYLRPAVKRPNLRVMTRTRVTRVIFANDAAIGIEVSDRRGRRTITCDREVILCAGAVNTPKLLMLSGVGPADELRGHGIGVVADVAEVGRNLQNHPGVDLQCATGHEDSLTAELNLLGRARLGADWAFRRKGLGATNFFETGAFLRTRDDVESPTCNTSSSH